MFFSSFHLGWGKNRLQVNSLQLFLHKDIASEPLPCIIKWRWREGQVVLQKTASLTLRNITLSAPGSGTMMHNWYRVNKYIWREHTNVVYTCRIQLNIPRIVRIVRSTFILFPRIMQINYLSISKYCSQVHQGFFVLYIEMKSWYIFGRF